MALKNLIKRQTINIDDHRRGCNEKKVWDDPCYDVHIDKRTNYAINGKMQKVQIKIPINSDKELTIESQNKGKLQEVPGKLKKEIRDAFEDKQTRDAFEDKQTRDAFIKDVLDILKNYETAFASIERAHQVTERLSKHFDLKWDSVKIEKIVNDILYSYTEFFKDDTCNNYYITINRKKGIFIGQNSGYGKIFK